MMINTINYEVTKMDNINNQIYSETYSAIEELYEIAKLKAGSIVVIGCSTSEVVGSTIGTNSSFETAGEIFKALHEFAKSKDIEIVKFRIKICVFSLQVIRFWSVSS